MGPEWMAAPRNLTLNAIFPPAELPLDSILPFHGSRAFFGAQKLDIFFKSMYEINP